MPFEPNLIYDVGAHMGEDSDFYLKKGFTVVAVEANPELAAKLRQRFADEIQGGRFRLVEAAIAPRPGEIDFFVNIRQSVWGTTSEELVARNLRLGAPSTRIRVPAVRFADILRENGIPHYLKIDIEGADLLCVKALAEFTDRPTFLSMETEKVSWQSLLGEIDALQGVGYNSFQIVEQSGVRRRVPPHPSREGTSIDYRFTAGASGLFGNDLPGPWLTVDETIRRYEPIFRRYRRTDKYEGPHVSVPVKVLRHLPLIRRYFAVEWHDLHATRV